MWSSMRSQNSCNLIQSLYCDCCCLLVTACSMSFTDMMAQWGNAFGTSLLIYDKLIQPTSLTAYTEHDSTSWPLSITANRKYTTHISSHTARVGIIYMALRVNHMCTTSHGVLGMFRKSSTVRQGTELLSEYLRNAFVRLFVPNNLDHPYMYPYSFNI